MRRLNGVYNKHLKSLPQKDIIQLNIFNFSKKNEKLQKLFQ